MSFVNMNKMSPEYIYKIESVFTFLDELKFQKKYQNLNLNEIIKVSEDLYFLNNQDKITEELIHKLTELKDE